MLILVLVLVSLVLLLVLVLVGLVLVLVPACPVVANITAGIAGYMSPNQVRQRTQKTGERQRQRRRWTKNRLQTRT